MRIEANHSDAHAANERDFTGPDGVTRQGIEVAIAACGRGRLHVGRYCIDENHAAALVLALQAGIAELQARAVSP